MTDKTTTDDQANNKAFPAPTPEEIVAERAQGVKDAIRQSATDAYKSGADQGYMDANAADAPSWAGSRNIMDKLDWLELTPDDLADRIGPKGGFPITEAQIAGLLEAERSGKNRTEHVKVYCDRLGVKSPVEVTAAGPNFTNDTSTVAI